MRNNVVCVLVVRTAAGDFQQGDQKLFARLQRNFVGTRRASKQEVAGVRRDTLSREEFEQKHTEGSVCSSSTEAAAAVEGTTEGRRFFLVFSGKS